MNQDLKTAVTSILFLQPPIRTVPTVKTQACAVLPLPLDL